MSVIPRIAWLPNLLSVLRLVLVPIYVVTAYRLGAAAAGAGADPAGLRSSAVGILLLSGATDVADGFLARHWDATTRFGAIVDAAADKITQVSALLVLTLVGSPAFPDLPVWLLGSVLVRDFVLGSGWLILPRLGRRADVAHELHGRLAAALVFLVLIAATAGAPRAPLVPVMLLAALAALLSASRYTLRAFRAEPRQGL